MSGKRIVLIGAGPVGSLLSIFLARRGLPVEIYERRPDMRRQPISAGRSINLAVSERGIHAMQAAGLGEDMLRQAVPMRGRMMHARDGELTFQPYGRDDSEFINSLSRGGLNKALMTAAEGSGLVKINFNSRVKSVDLTAPSLEVEDELSKRTYRVEADVIIGTDGSASVLRTEVMKSEGACLSESVLDYGYKELTIPGLPGGGFALEPNALHIWPRGSYMLIALPNCDGSFTCTLFLPFDGEPGFSRLRDEESASRFFQEQFPDAYPLIENFGESFCANPTGQMVTIKCLPWSVGGKVLLVGDAAHAIVPFFGQGMNCGFEDCVVLDGLIERIGRGQAIDWQSVFEQFVASRKENTDAIADLAVENFVEMRDKVASKRFLLEKAVEKILLNEFPDEYRSRYSLVTFSRVPYKLAKEAGIVSDGILSELCRDIEKAEDVDLNLARKLIATRLAPVLGGLKAR